MKNEEISPQDEAMEKFREAFNLPLLGCKVSDDGLEMRVRVNIDRVAARYLLQANCLIDSNQLPLTAYIKEWVIKGVLFGRYLIISFDHSKMELPCY